MTRKIINFVLFQAAWFSCVLSGAHQTPLIAVAVASAVIAISLRMGKGNLCADLRLLAVVGGIGFCIDSMNLLAGVFALNGSPWPMFICPPWLVLIWIVFGTTLRSSLGWLAGRYWLSAALGAVAGPPSYFAGAKLGAVTMDGNWMFSAIALTATWAMVMPSMVWLAHGRSVDSARQTADRL
ncbi:MAG: DUF2878 domain-containing protein [Lentisphaerae bacterium]|nr:DUF2878 domain-containing protein [Lentisphaerota bacterium]